MHFDRTRTIRRITVAALAVVTACAQTTTPTDGGNTVDVAVIDAPADTASSDATLPATDAGGFCADPNSARIALNGVVAESPAPSASLILLNCCDSALLRVTTARFTDSIAVVWRHQIGQGPDLPVTLDLANLPDGWSVWLVDGCEPTMSSCTPVDRYDSGLTGTLHIERAADGQVRMSACLDVSEPASMPHPVVHSLQLWVPSVTTTM